MTVQSVEVKLLRPTQIAVGMKLVKAKRKGLRARERRPTELVEFILENPIRVIAGPAKQFFVVDHHHLAHALLDEGFETAPVVLLGDLSKTPRGKFWAEMATHGWVHAFDGKGRKRPVSAIPLKIKDMQDDPYRSLAGFVRLRGGYHKSENPFAEFLWADFFRTRIPLKQLKKNFIKAMVSAMELASSPDTAQLPGYIAEHKVKETDEVQKTLPVKTKRSLKAKV